MNRNLCVAALSGAAVAIAASSAQGSAVLSLTYNELEARYNATTGLFEAFAVDSPSLQTTGEVAKLVGPSQQTAAFTTGFFVSPGTSNFELTMNKLAPTDTQPTVGNFFAYDVDGDWIGGSFSGSWALSGFGFLTFSGTVFNVQLNLAQNGTFDGDSGSFDATGLPALLNGSIVQLTLGGGAGFTSDFSGAADTVAVQLVPTPGAASLLALSAAAVLRRRRA
jgi:hypothetical protein